MTTENQTVFVAPNGSAFAYLSDIPLGDGRLAYSPDGETFYALAGGGFSGSSEEHDISFENPHSGISAKLHRKGDTITCGMEVFKAANVPFDTSKIVPLPTVRRVEYLCQAEDGTFYYVGADKYNYSYESFRLYVGDGKEMREVAIEGVQRFKDGGTTFIVTDEGTFFSPTAFDKELQMQWGDGEVLRQQFDAKHGGDECDAPIQTVLTQLDAKDFDIVEDEGGVRISPKS